MPHSFLEGEKLGSPVIHMNPVTRIQTNVTRIHTNEEIADDKREVGICNLSDSERC
jgi:hypothetical protein